MLSTKLAFPLLLAALLPLTAGCSAETAEEEEEVDATGAEESALTSGCGISQNDWILEAGGYSGWFRISCSLPRTFTARICLQHRVPRGWETSSCGAWTKKTATAVYQPGGAPRFDVTFTRGGSHLASGSYRLKFQPSSSSSEAYYTRTESF